MYNGCFSKKELTGYLKNRLETQKSVYQHVVYDSAGIEKRFTGDLKSNEAIKVYAKLRGWFKVPPPLGTYNLDSGMFLWKPMVRKSSILLLKLRVATGGMIYGIR